jgi:DNA-binding MltR family transcriptional regulator
MAELIKESDRGSVVLAATWIDEGITNLLKYYMAPSHKHKKDGASLLDTGRPLGDFSVKMDLEYRLGPLPKKTIYSLHIIRGLRNYFAHKSTLLTFESNSVKDRIINLLDGNAEIIATMGRPNIPNTVASIINQYVIKMVFSVYFPAFFLR